MYGRLKNVVGDNEANAQHLLAKIAAYGSHLTIETLLNYITIFKLTFYYCRYFGKQSDVVDNPKRLRKVLIQMTDLNYRNADLSDLKRIVEIYNSSIPSRMVTADTEPVSVESKRQWFNEHNSSNRPLWVIENENGLTVGWVSFQSFYGRPAYDATVEISIYLDIEQRGKGLGKRILQHCIQRAPDFGIKTLLGFIFTHNAPSLKLFRQFGFEDWGTLPNIAVLDGQERGLKILGKRVA